MTIPKAKKPSTGALKWIAGLMGRMDAALARSIPALAEAMQPKPMPKCVSFHKRPGYTARPKRSARARHRAAVAGSHAGTADHSRRFYNQKGATA